MKLYLPWRTENQKSSVERVNIYDARGKTIANDVPREHAATIVRLIETEHTRGQAKAR